MTDYSFWLLWLAVIGMVANVFGALGSAWLISSVWGDYRATQMMDVGADRRIIASEAVWQESLRFLLQVFLLWGRLPGLWVAPERYSTVVNDLWPLVLNRGVVDFLISTILAYKSYRAFRSRTKLLGMPLPFDADNHPARRATDRSNLGSNQ